MASSGLLSSRPEDGTGLSGTRQWLAAISRMASAQGLGMTGVGQ